MSTLPNLARLYVAAVILTAGCLLATLLPSVDGYLESNRGAAAEALLVRGLANTDARVRDGKAVTPSFLFALLLYGPIARLIEAAPPDRWHDNPCARHAGGIPDIRRKNRPRQPRAHI